MNINRRAFLQGGIVTSAISLGGQNTAYATDVKYDDVEIHYKTRAEDGFDPIHMYVHKIKDKFFRHWVLGQAAQILHTNFRDIDVARNAYNIPNLNGPPAHFVTDAAYEASNLDAHPTYSRRHLLWYQLEILRLPDSAKEEGDEGPPFPPIHIYPMYEDSDVHGRVLGADVGRVIVKYEDARSSRRTGEFVVQVNLKWLGGERRGEGIGLDPRHWATVIGHEMLHSLGHMHKLMEYVDGRQINAFHRSLYCGGSYDGNRDTTTFGCHPTI